jgi:hypothetical protein
MQIALAPMEGLVDDILRDVLTQVGGIDWCVTEFIRVTERLLPAHYFHKFASELLTDAKTRAGVPLRVQLLGSDPVCLAENAAFAAELGAPVIDLNFGCPAKTVNKSRGGAVLLKEPELLHSILSHVRRAVPAHIPVTAKMRLGYDSTEPALDCAKSAGGRWRRTHRGPRANQGRWLQAARPLGVDRQDSGRGKNPDHRQWRDLDRRRLAPLPRNLRRARHHDRSRPRSAS